MSTQITSTLYKANLLQLITVSLTAEPIKTDEYISPSIRTGEIVFYTRSVKYTLY
jgi:hypothetical protein